MCGTGRSFRFALIFILFCLSSFLEALPENYSSNISNTDSSFVAIDIDGNNELDALTDGLLLLRGMFGLTGDALVNGVIGVNATYSSSADIESRIANLGNIIDIDGNGNIDALTDGLIILRYLFGIRGETMLSGVTATDSVRSTVVDVESYLERVIAPPPVITSSAAFTAEENQTSIGTVIAKDSLDDTLIYRYQEMNY